MAMSCGIFKSCRGDEDALLNDVTDALLFLVAGQLTSDAMDEVGALAETWNSYVRRGLKWVTDFQLFMW